MVDSLFEEFRVGFERNNFNDNQHKILICLIFAKLYTYKIVDSVLVFEILYFILTYNPEWEMGRREIVADNAYDSPRDTIRIIMVVTLLDNCGSYFKEGSRKEKLEEFIHFFQIYILSKVYTYLP